MNKLDESPPSSHFQLAETIEPFAQQESTLRSEVEKSLRRYFQHIEDEPVTDLHSMVMSEVEAPLIEAVMRYTGNNQSKASILLGLNRGTLRTKLKQYGLL
ncbi:MAG: DNA-binding transcriptional regulator Fis [Gammaproteobacteria bacterium]|nr:DNA-binding transcriptional regulator Fis [Gammaproteobacteria bacterium]MDD9897306.1 DNA-binding transcriptional regulator Fis [Gammaproteobacteria bacterium]MDD9959448.1 DNA-binding transcriptional regulator Fis [Gammaproteobacteria bacterium]